MGKPTSGIYSAQLHLVALITLLLVPIIAAAMTLAVVFSEVERDRYQQDALDVARRILGSVDRELLADRKILEVLSTSPSLSGGDLAAFRVELEKTGEIMDAGLVYKRADGQILVDTGASAGTPLPRLLTETDQVALRMGGGTVSGLVLGPGEKAPWISIHQPVFDGEALTHLLVMRVAPSRLDGLLAAENLPGDWTAALIDGNDLIVARSRDPARFRGAIATEDLRRSTPGQAGIFVGTTKDGVPVLSAYVRSDLTGWRAVVGVPVETVERPLRRSLFWLAAVGLIGLTIGIGAASWFGRRISRAMGEAAGAAAGLGRAAPVPEAAASSILEINQINESIATAAAELRARAQARTRAEEALAAANSRLERVLDTSPVGIVEVGADKVIRYTNVAAARMLGLSEAGGEGRRYDAPEWCIQTPSGGAIAAEDLPVSQAFRGEVVLDCELSIALPGQDRRNILSVNAIPVYEDGVITGALAAFTDISKRHEVERHQRLLINELNHRVKNTLATVNSIAAQSLRSTSSTAEAREAFTGRIVALAQAHDVLTRERWEGADLIDVVKGAIEPYGAERFHVDGVPVRLSPQTALSVAMALHELATNAVKYGALSLSPGRVSIRWTIDRTESGRALRFVWKEAGGPPVTQPTRRGFGSRLIETGLSRELGGSVRIQFEPTGVVCTIDAPIEGV